MAQSLVLSSEWNSLMHRKSKLEIGFYIVKNNIIQYRNIKRNCPVQTSYTLEMDTVFLKITFKKSGLKTAIPGNKIWLIPTKVLDLLHYIIS